MLTDYQKTGKLYKKLNAYTKGNCTQAMTDPAEYYYFGSTEQFETCKSFVAYLEQKHKGHKFIANIAR